MPCLDLSDAVHTLPQEISDIIRDYVFSIDSEPVDVEEQYKSLALFQVDRTTQEAFAKTFYANTTFTFQSSLGLSVWLCSLRPEHRALVSKLFYDPPWQDLPSRSELSLGPSTTICEVVDRFELICSWLTGDHKELFGSELEAELKMGLRFEGEDVVWSAQPKMLLLDIHAANAALRDSGA